MKNDATGDPIIAPTFIKVGTFNSGTNKGSDLYKIIAGCTMGDANCIAALATFDPTQKKFKVFGSYSATMPRDPKNILTDETMTASNSNLALVNALNVPLEKLSYISTETIPDFAVPSAVALAGGYGLTQQSVPSGALGNVQPTAVGEAIDGTKVYVDMNQYFLRLPSNEYILYKITIPFFADERIPQINWNDPSIKPTDYTPTYASGCGGGKSFNIATPGDVTLPSDRFVVAGKPSPARPSMFPKTATIRSSLTPTRRAVIITVTKRSPNKNSPRSSRSSLPRTRSAKRSSGRDRTPSPWPNAASRWCISIQLRPKPLA